MRSVAAIDVLPSRATGEIHLAGFARDTDAAGDELLIDSHGTPVAEAVWALSPRGAASDRSPR